MSACPDQLLAGAEPHDPSLGRVQPQSAGVSDELLQKPFVSPPPPNRGAEYCDERVCLSVCLCVCLYVRAHILGNYKPDLDRPKFLCMIGYLWPWLGPLVEA